MKSRTPFLVLISLISLIILPVCVGQSQPTAKTIEIKDFSFQPNSIIVSVGTIVTWVNNGPSTHTVTSDDGKFNSGNIITGGQFKFTFSQPGTYKYHCNIHPSMTGVVTVTSAQPVVTPPAATKPNTTQPTMKQPSTASMPAVVLTPQDWPMVNYDNNMSRHSQQTIISRDNVNQLQVKWILNTGHTLRTHL